jgi:hypothetical protein
MKEKYAVVETQEHPNPDKNYVETILELFYSVIVRHA